MAGFQHHRSDAEAGTLGGAMQEAVAHTTPYTDPLPHADGPNGLECANFKGWFRTGDGQRIDPLTISDAHSRYLLHSQAVEKTPTNSRVHPEMWARILFGAQFFLTR